MLRNQSCHISIIPKLKFVFFTEYRKKDNNICCHHHHMYDKLRYNCQFEYFLPYDIRFYNRRLPSPCKYCIHYRLQLNDTAQLKHIDILKSSSFQRMHFRRKVTRGINLDLQNLKKSLDEIFRYVHESLIIITCYVLLTFR